MDLKHQLTQHHWESGCSVAGVEGTRQGHQITGVEKILVGLDRQIKTWAVFGKVAGGSGG